MGQKEYTTRSVIVRSAVPGSRTSERTAAARLGLDPCAGVTSRSRAMHEAGAKKLTTLEERPMSSAVTPQFEEATYKKAASRLIPFVFLCYIVAFLDRVNVGFAKLQMASDLKFSDAIYGVGAGVFFIGYFIFEVPSNVILEKVGARVWIARIMITWGLISSAFLFTGDLHWGAVATAFGWSDAQFSFYFLRFLL